MTPRYRRTFRDSININPEISHGLLAIFLFVVSGLSVLSFFSMAGVVGQFIDSFLAIVFGQVRYAFPLVLIIVAILIIKDLEYEYRATHWLGSILFFLSFNGLVHLHKPVANMLDLALQGYGGGLVGLVLAWPLGMYVGYWGGLVILFGVLLVSLIFLFNTSLAQVVALNKKIFLLFGWLGKQVVSFFGSFKKDKVVFKVKGEQNTVAQTDEYISNEEDEDEEERRIFERRAIARQMEKEKEEEEEEKQETSEAVKEDLLVIKPDYSNYKLPSLDLLQNVKSKPTSGDIKANAESIKNTLKNFGIEVEMGEVRIGPTVTQYSLKPYDGIKLSRITGLSDNLALALAAHPIRIEAPIPGQSLVGIEVPNQKVAMVTLYELLNSPEFKNRKTNTMLALGKDVSGKVNVVELTKMPHLLVAGTTNSGKTVCVNTLILSLIFQNSPETLRFIMIDPKQVEFTLYNGIPHLMTPVITDPAQTVNALQWAINEMEKRFTVFRDTGSRDIVSHNQKSEEKMPYIIIVIDELADLMHTTAAEVEHCIVRLAQKARASGIHLIVATQRPSVEVVTGLMKANMPGRITFKLKSVTDSRTILDSPGAEKLLGNGDMLYQTQEMSKPRRLQGSFISENEIIKVVDFLKGDEPPVYDESIVSKGNNASGTPNMFGGPSDSQDPMLEDAKKLILESGKASASYLQRFLKVGYSRAARMLDQLEEAGIVGPAEGAKPREVFMEHLMPAPEMELTDKEQTLDSGGVVLDEPVETEVDVPVEENKIET